MAIDYGFPSDGITAETPQRILFGAGTLHRGLSYNESTHKWNGKETILCATTGGSSLKIETEITEPDIDGKWVKVEDTMIMTGGTATLEINPAELSVDVLKMCLIGEDMEDVPENYEGVQSTDVIQPSHYVNDLAFVGQLINGDPIIVFFDRALCTSGLEISTGNKEQATPKATFEAVGKLDESHKKIPWKIVMPKPHWTVRYDTNGGTGTRPSDQVKIKDTALTLAAGTGLTKTGFTFNGWNTQSNGEGTHYAASGSYTANANVLLYAEWEAEESVDEKPKADNKKSVSSK